MTARRLLPILAVVLAVLGVGALIGAVLVPGRPTAAPATPAPTAVSVGVPTPSPVPTLGGTPTPTPTPTAGISAAALDLPIVELADAAWAKRIAAAGGIPERAMLAYAGAALRLAATDPGCGIGWNTLAAIGYVESEHGMLQGGRIGPDGVASPTVIGIPIGADTDKGALDGDPAQDRAVGPMQFIPSSWALLAQDGNHDGARDVNSIDNAVLAAAVHLCDVGGDLTQPAGWIAAINAYNPSVEYNNRVAEAADRYAALR